MVLPKMVVLNLFVFADLATADSITGTFFDGTGDLDFLNLLDKARRQSSSAEYELQSVPMLYRGDWDGLMEGPTWGAWWTQNSYGTTMTSLPFMSPQVYHTCFHSQSWWFDSIGDGYRVGLTNEGPAPDGCLCDAALPCPGTGECCYYKQGDGNVPRHDWTFEETLSAVMMQAEMLLVSRNHTGARHFLPLFLV
jgi:hypothetical protein